MTPKQIKIVRENFKAISPRAGEAASVFYDNLFLLDASLRPMFPAGDLHEQKEKLMMMLKFAIDTLDRIDVFEPSLEVLGRRHFDCGVRDEHYDLAGAALILTLRQLQGADFTREIETAWFRTFALIAGIMRRAARESANDAPATIVMPPPATTTYEGSYLV